MSATPAAMKTPTDNEINSLHADEHEKYDFHDFVHQFLEQVDVLPRCVRHRELAPAVADQQPYDHHGQRPGM